MTINNTATEKGFTLIELMVVVGIIGILTAIAYPSYTEHVRKSARAEAMSAVLDAANKLEQYYVDNRAYTSTLTDLNLTSSTESGYYTMAVTLSDANQSFTVTATAAAGPAASDSDCTSFSVTDTGRKSATGAASTTCWGKVN